VTRPSRYLPEDCEGGRKSTASSMRTSSGARKRRGFEFTAPLLLWEAFHKVGDADRHDVDYFRRCVLGKGGEECFDVRFVALGRDDYDFVDAVVVQLARSSFMARCKVFRRSVPVPGYGAQSGLVRP